MASVTRQSAPSTGAARESAAVSHVGKIRSNNQDSGYAGRHLFVVADGMGGHAGGDVASSIAIKRIAEADRAYSSPYEAEDELKRTLIAANTLLADAVIDHPELTGMGTTVSAIARVHESVAIAHIGDSRIYVLRKGKLEQVTTDHTFVQRLVESGRITEEEAMTHPRRSVLMRVLGDVHTNPEIDTLTLETEANDRWLICSDGLSGVVPHDEILRELSREEPAQRVAERLIRDSLLHGAPDNVTVVILDIASDTAHPLEPVPEPVVVGSAAAPIPLKADDVQSRVRVPGRRSHPRSSAAQGPTHFEPASEDYLDELIEEDRRRHLRRRITWLMGLSLVLIIGFLGVFFAYDWTQSRFYVSTNGTTVVIYQGIQQSVGPLSLSEIKEDTGIPLNTLREYDVEQLKHTISADSYASAVEIVRRLTEAKGSP
ncbi:PP2C family protein-serine/threonine phosphatase [Rathayibacter toxicus]|uniref:Protein phosphatase n=1 Tax=Rathayibacter toxicus TaxID=145458 RepID=A0A0U1PT59_9MICO|nr:PP2C family serine/threonine-protein phosphatase [Rathayibacter toxicus]ALS57316.1 protein phosphatase [Rathayibacter toxicus]KKM45715.1 protein phosphatase [Rathayibacter toxicus]PPG24806.1 serine/threonine-protein phosphatase [Rathayibacter toxicus]PPG48261.1 serine/threonine-protein phosphatase [Rathayibacter toxicus]PPH59257.1 serine/threonine-protein phosphatase [Rathayibacter toxicus]